MTDINDKRLKTEELVTEIINYSRDTLLVNLRFLDAAMSRLIFASGSSSYATDGYMLKYDPQHVLNTYREERTLPSRNILHVIFHCVFRHICPPEEAVSDSRKKKYWDAACDIAAEYTITSLNLQAAACRYQNRMTRVFNELFSSVDMLTAEKLYRFFIKSAPAEDEIAAYERLFRVDDHSSWNNTKPELNDIWQEISRRMQIDMETFTRQQGDNAKALMLNLKETNRKVSDYTDFLKKFATRGDGMKLDPDEFDYTLYSYGMQMSGGKIPLLEQTEYRDPLRVRDIAMAIFAHDILTQDKVRLFLLNTWDILHSTESSYSKVRLHVLLPSKTVIPDTDGKYTEILASIEEKVVTSTEEMQKFVNGLTVPDAHGGDYRPVFDRLNEIKGSSSFRNLRGLLILTEDVGIFPNRMPSYPSAFIFVNNDYSTPDVPPWAIRLVLQGDDL